MAHFVVQTTTEGECDFDFDKWISQNKLDEVKELFVKHGLITLKSLTFVSTEFKQLMTDPLLFQKSHIIPNIMDAMQTVPNDSKPQILKIIVSEEEQHVIDNIEEKLKRLHETEQQINELNVYFPKTQLKFKNEQYKQIDIVNTKIAKLFDELYAVMNLKKNYILKQVQEIKNNIDKSNDDEKEYHLLQSSMNSIRTSRQYLTNQLQLCDELTSTNDKKHERKNKIINIGEEVDDKYSITDKSLTNDIKSIRKSIQNNNSKTTNIALMLNNESYQRIINDIIQIGYVTNRTLPISDDNKYNNDDVDHVLNREFAEFFKVHICDLGDGFIQKSNEAQAHDLIRSLIDLHDRFLTIIKHHFQSKAIFHKALKEAFEEIINKEHYISPKLAAYTNHILEKGSALTVVDIDNVMDHIVMLYGYIRDKDIFQRDYKQYLAQRLILDSSNSEQSERLMIDKFSKTKGAYHWISKLEDMFKESFKDMQRSKALMIDFHNKYTEFECKLNVCICSNGSWPTSSIQHIKKPSDIIDVSERFKQFYLDRYGRRRLTFLMNESTADLSVQFNATTAKILAVSGYQMMILLLFNDKNRLTFKEIQDKTRIPRIDLQNAALALTNAKVLQKSPYTNACKNDDKFQINSRYKNPYKRITVGKSNFMWNNVDVMEAVYRLRRHQLDAAIVRIMKARKTVKHSDLVNELVKQLAGRFRPRSDDCKKRIANLIQLEYLERDENDRESYHYKT